MRQPISCRELQISEMFFFVDAVVHCYAFNVHNDNYGCAKKEFCFKSIVVIDLLSSVYFYWFLSSTSDSMTSGAMSRLQWMSAGGRTLFYYMRDFFQSENFASMVTYTQTVCNPVWSSIKVHLSFTNEARHFCTMLASIIRSY